MADQNLSHKVAELKRIYQHYHNRLLALQRQQNQLIAAFVKELEKRKIGHIRTKTS